MSPDQRAQIQTVIRKTPKTIWAYWPFLLPIVIVVIGVAINVMLVVYFERKIPDLEVLFKDGNRIQPVWDSQLVCEAVMTTSMSITVTFLMFVYLARLSFRYATLLKATAKDIGLDEACE